MREEIAQLESQLPPVGPTLCSIRNDPEQLEPTFLLRRGDPELQGPKLGMRLPGVLVPDGEPELSYDAPRPRTRLAEALTDPSNPLTPRVIVNRIWQQHFGRGLVSTANDFGQNGSPPSHPDLLDDLASRFVAGGWRLKSLHREIVTSSTYQQAPQSLSSSPARESDPENLMLWSFPRRRLSGEEIRDAMLAISGSLNLQMGGRSVILPVEQELVDQLYKPSQWKVSELPEQHFRRSIYLISKRNLRLPFMESFDQPSAQTSCAGREQSTHARQALELLNGRITNELAAALADRLQREASPDPADQVRLAYRLTTARNRRSRNWHCRCSLSKTSACKSSRWRCSTSMHFCMSTKHATAITNRKLP